MIYSVELLGLSDMSMYDCDGRSDDQDEGLPVVVVVAMSGHVPRQCLLEPASDEYLAISLLLLLLMATLMAVSARDMRDRVVVDPWVVDKKVAYLLDNHVPCPVLMGTALCQGWILLDDR